MADTLKEFLVKIKYQQEGQKDLKSDVEGIGKSVIALGTKIIGATAAAALGVSKLAQSYEQLYFVANRTHTTVDNLRALQVASESLGSTADGAKSSLEGMAAFMRNTPASANWMEGWGVKTKDAKGQQLDSVEIMKNVATRFQQFDKEGQGYMAHQYAGMLGIDSNQEMAMRNPEYNKQLDSFRADLKNANGTGAGNAAHDAVNIGRHKMLEIKSLESQGLEKVLHTFVDLDKATNGLSTDVVAGAVALTGLAVAAKTVTGIFKAMSGAGSGAGAAEAVAGGAAGAGAATAAKSILGAGMFARILTGAGALLYSPSLNEGEDEAVRNMNHGSGKVNYGGKRGAMDKMLDGIRRAESGGNPNAVSKAGAMGPYQLMPATAAFYHVDPFNETQARGAAMQEMSKNLQRYHGNTDQALQAYNWGSGNMDSYIATGYGKRHQVMPQETRDYPGRVAKGMNITSTINVNGVQNPLVTAQAVQAAQTRTYQLAARNTAGVTR